MYFKDGSKIFRINYNDFSVTELVDEGTNDIGIELTNSKVVYVAGPPFGSDGVYEMKAVPKAGGPGVTLVTTGSDEYINIYATSDSHIYYTNYTRGNYPRKGVVGHIQDDGSGLSEITNALYAGQIYFATLRLYNISPDRILRFDGCADESDCTGATLKSFDAATYTNELILGTLPDDINNLYLETSLENPLILTGRSSSEPTHDIFFVDVTKSNSLQRITNSPSLNEWVIN